MTRLASLFFYFLVSAVKSQQYYLQSLQPHFVHLLLVHPPNESTSSSERRRGWHSYSSTSSSVQSRVKGTTCDPLGLTLSTSSISPPTQAQLNESTSSSER